MHSFFTGNGTSLLASHGDAVLLPRSLFTSRGSTSVLQYLPKSELDFGVVACWASNAVGNQREPCLFHVVPAGTLIWRRPRSRHCSRRYAAIISFVGMSLEGSFRIYVYAASIFLLLIKTPVRGF